MYNPVFKSGRLSTNTLKAEKRRLHDENKHRDKRCSVSVKAVLPDRLPTQLYAPAGAPFTKRFNPIVELVLVFLGLGVPLYFYYDRKLSKRLEHRVRKTIYIDCHDA